MAITKLTADYLKANEPLQLTDLKALDGSLGAEFIYDSKDRRTLFIVENTNSSPGTLTITAGDTWQRAAADRTISVPANKKMGIELMSGRYVQAMGAGKCRIEFKGPATLKMGVVVLP